MLTKEFAITLDMKRALAFHPFEVVECDTGNVLHILLQNDGAAMDLTGCDVCVVFASSKGFAMQDLTSGVSLGPSPGQIDVLLYADSFGAGEVTADVQVYSGPERGTLITSRRFTFRCITSLISADSIRASATYPPLIAATRAAADAANAALAAAASVGEAVGEMNVQSDWNETDAVSDAYIKHKPAIPSTPGEVGAAAALHAARHAATGADAVTPEAIGAAAAEHAARHAAGGADEITPSAIGAEKAQLQFEDVAVAAEDWNADTTYADYLFRAAAALPGALANMTPEVILDAPEAAGGSFAPVAKTFDGGVYLYAAEAPEDGITIPAIILWKAAG